MVSCLWRVGFQQGFTSARTVYFEYNTPYRRQNFLCVNSWRGSMSSCWILFFWMSSHRQPVRSKVFHLHKNTRHIPHWQRWLKFRKKNSCLLIFGCRMPTVSFPTLREITFMLEIPCMLEIPSVSHLRVFIAVNVWNDGSGTTIIVQPCSWQSFFGLWLTLRSGPSGVNKQDTVELYKCGIRDHYFSTHA